MARGEELNWRNVKAIKSVSRSVEIGLRVIGVWPGMPYATLHRVFWFTTLTIAQVFQYRYAAMHIGVDDIATLMDGLSTTMSYSLLFIKLMIVWAKRRIVYDILFTMAADWRKVDSKPAMDRGPMTEMADLSRRSSNVLIGLYPTSVVLYAAGVIVSELDPGNVRVDGESRELLLKMELPFDSNISPFYEIVMVVQFFHQLVSATIVGVLNAILVTLILHIAGEIDMICQGFEEISSKSSRDVSPASALGLLIGEHQKILRFSSSMENLLCYIALMQIFWNTLVICTLGFVIVNSLESRDNSATLVKTLFYYIVVTLEAFIYCSAGEYLSEKGKMIGEAAYGCAWYELKPREAKLLFILIMRSQKRLTITVGKFTNLSLQHFTTIIKTCASYISVLRAMY